MQIPLNLELMKNPINWLIIGLMVMLAVLGLSLIFPAGGHPAQSET